MASRGEKQLILLELFLIVNYFEMHNNSHRI